MITLLRMIAVLTELTVLRNDEEIEIDAPGIFIAFPKKERSSDPGVRSSPTSVTSVKFRHMPRCRAVDVLKWQPGLVHYIMLPSGQVCGENWCCRELHCYSQKRASMIW